MHFNDFFKQFLAYNDHKFKKINNNLKKEKYLINKQSSLVEKIFSRIIDKT